MEQIKRYNWSGHPDEHGELVHYDDAFSIHMDLTNTLNDYNRLGEETVNVAKLLAKMFEDSACAEYHEDIQQIATRMFGILQG